MTPRTLSEGAWLKRVGGSLLLVVLLGQVTGCTTIRPGDTVYRIKAVDLEEEKVIRRKLWHVGRAVEDVRVRYALDDITVSVVITDLGGLGEATPTFSGLADVSGARILLSKRLFLEDHPELDMVLTGLLAHEMMHALQYARMPKQDLIEVGRRYNAAMDNPNGPQREWVRAFERLTDMMTIKLGYGEELTYQKAASEANLAANDPAMVWDFYLTEPEIRAMMADSELLDREMRAAVDVLGLPSARVMLETPVVLDEHGDLVPIRRR